MKSLYESILDIDNNINQANTNIKNVNKIKSIIHDFVDDIIDTNKYSYTLIRKQEGSKNIMTNGEVVRHTQLSIKMWIDEYKNDDYSTYTWFKSVLYKHKKDLMSIRRILGCDKDPEVCCTKRYDDIYIEQLMDEYYDYNFYIRKMKGEIFITVNDIYIDDIKKLIDSKNIIRP